MKFAALSLIALCFLALASSGTAQPTIRSGSFSGTMTLNCSDFSPVPSVLPAVTPVSYSANPSTGVCVTSFAGMTCIGKVNSNGVCEFTSQDCGGPAGWNCVVYYQGVEEGYGDVYVIRCNFPGDHLLNFSYSGSSSPDVLGGQITIK